MTFVGEFALVLASTTARHMLNPYYSDEETTEALDYVDHLIDVLEEVLKESEQTQFTNVTVATTLSALAFVDENGKIEQHIRDVLSPVSKFLVNWSDTHPEYAGT